MLKRKVVVRRGYAITPLTLAWSSYRLSMSNRIYLTTAEWRPPAINMHITMKKNDQVVENILSSEQWGSPPGGMF